MAVIIDAAEYFKVVRQAVLGARHSVILIAWDFDTRILLDPREDEDRDVPNELGELMKHVVQSRPDIHVHILKWNLGALQSLARGDTSWFMMKWVMSSRVHFRLDHAHPAGSAHHQKIVVIDDAVAFCGGIDITADRWDTREHKDHDPHRIRPWSKTSYGPWHDATTAVSGPAAKALANLARDRWYRATGQELAPPPSVTPAWPDNLEPLFEGVPVAIARTLPKYNDWDAAYEIEALYLEIIAAARRTLYIESQYFASPKLGAAIAERLQEPEGPEIVIVNPMSADGWLEEEVMGSARAKLLRMVHRADTYDRFRLYTPVSEGGTDIYVHAKVLVLDDKLLRVGSSNLNNRSLGYDTECDLAIEAGEDDSDLKARIARVRDDLLAEHLNAKREEVEQAFLRTGGSLIQTIESLTRPGRSLKRFSPPDLNQVEEEVLADNELLDPERPRKGPNFRGLVHRITGALQNR
ncbi:phospholipase D-like domain-containing protein [Roseivivax sp. CAU 1761]